MKIASVIIFCLFFSLTGCDQTPEVGEQPQNTAETTPAPKPDDGETTVKTPEGEKAPSSESKSGGEPKFGDYPAEETYTGSTAALVFDNETSEFKTRFREASKGDVNFAGRYIVARWGCGTDCLMGGLIDAKTGKTSMLPFTVCCILEEGEEDREKMEFRKDSRLIIFNGLLNENEEGGRSHFYEIKDGELKELKK